MGRFFLITALPNPTPLPLGLHPTSIKSSPHRTNQSKLHHANGPTVPSCSFYFVAILVVPLAWSCAIFCLYDMDYQYLSTRRLATWLAEARSVQFKNASLQTGNRTHRHSQNSSNSINHITNIAFTAFLQLFSMNTKRSGIKCNWEKERDRNCCLSQLHKVCLSNHCPQCLLQLPGHSKTWEEHGGFAAKCVLMIVAG